MRSPNYTKLNEEKEKKDDENKSHFPFLQERISEAFQVEWKLGCGGVHALSLRCLSATWGSFVFFPLKVKCNEGLMSFRGVFSASSLSALKDNIMEG